jgi:hypothetical protein
MWIWLPPSSFDAADWEVGSARDRGVVDEGLGEKVAAWDLRNQTSLATKCRCSDK